MSSAGPSGYRGPYTRRTVCDTPTAGGHSMTATTTEGAATGGQQAADATTGQQQSTTGATATDQQAQQQTQVGAGQQQAGDQQGQTQQQDAADLTPEEEAALGDAGKRAIERVKGERQELRTKLDTATTELTTVKQQLAQALEQINKGGDKAQAAQLETITTERDTAKLDQSRVLAVLRNGVAMPKQGEQPAEWAQRVQQVAGLLQGADDATLDASAQVLLSLAGGGQVQQAQRVTTGDTAAAAAGGGQAGELSMSDRIRQAAGRAVR